ncbi:MAG: exodeoxyribonuclease VII small subunit [Tissierellia bacterium]|nr:exodeoxyribonuclease VII small subunit [Tissierellia bacterium]
MDDFNFRNEYEKLNKILEDISNNDSNIEEDIRLYQKATDIYNNLEKKLNEYELKIIEIKNRKINDDE